MDEQKKIMDEWGQEMAETIILPNAQLEMKSAAFAAVWERLVAGGSTHEAAYLIADAAHEVIYGSRKYSSYDSFRNARSRPIRQLHKMRKGKKP